MPGQEFETGNLTIAVMQSDAFGQEFSPHSLPVEFKVDDFEAARPELESRGVAFEGDTLDSGVCHQAFFAIPTATRWRSTTATRLRKHDSPASGGHALHNPPPCHQRS